ncbi:hypothetical protein HBI12_208000 [Parastagonospora nodorum]|nr:hypothetical protein HBI12_208000 [Parastagonospora nodorum]
MILLSPFDNHPTLLYNTPHHDATQQKPTLEMGSATKRVRIGYTHADRNGVRSEMWMGFGAPSVPGKTPKSHVYDGEGKRAKVISFKDFAYDTRIQELQDCSAAPEDIKTATYRLHKDYFGEEQEADDGASRKRNAPSQMPKDFGQPSKKPRIANEPFVVPAIEEIIAKFLKLSVPMTGAEMTRIADYLKEKHNKLTAPKLSVLNSIRANGARDGLKDPNHVFRDPLWYTYLKHTPVAGLVKEAATAISRKTKDEDEDDTPSTPQTRRQIYLDYLVICRRRHEILEAAFAALREEGIFGPEAKEQSNS